MKQAIKDPSKAPRLMVNNQPMAFCCAGCAPQVKKDPAKYIKTTKDPVTGKPFKVTASTPKMEHKGGLYLFSSARTHEQFHHNPEKYARSGHHGNHKSH
jgi:YHS domain-containing protein